MRVWTNKKWILIIKMWVISDFSKKSSLSSKKFKSILNFIKLKEDNSLNLKIPGSTTWRNSKRNWKISFKILSLVRRYWKSIERFKRK